MRFGGLVAVVCALGAASCLSVPTSEGGDAGPGRADASGDAGGQVDGGDALPPAGQLSLAAPVVAAIGTDLGLGQTSDLIVVADGGHAIVVFAGGPDDPAPVTIVSAREIYAITPIRVGDDVDLLAVVREEGSDKLVVSVIDVATGDATLSCSPPAEPTLASGAPVRLGLSNVAGTTRIGVLTETEAWLSLEFSGTGCPGWDPPGTAGGAAPRLVADRGGGMVQVKDDAAFFFVVGGEAPIAAPSPVAAATIARLEGGLEPTVMAATAAGLATLSPAGGAIVEARALGAARAIVSSDLDGDGQDDLLVLDADATSSTVVAYRALRILASEVATEPCTAGNDGAACTLTLPEPFDFAAVDPSQPLDGAVYLIDRDGRYRCVTLATGALAPCS